MKPFNRSILKYLKLLFLAAISCIFGCATVGRQKYLNMEPDVKYKSRFGSISSQIPSVEFLAKNKCYDGQLSIEIESDDIKSHEYFYGPAIAPVLPIPYFYGETAYAETLLVRVSIRSATTIPKKLFNGEPPSFFEKEYKPEIVSSDAGGNPIIPIKVTVEKYEESLLYMNYWFNIRAGTLQEGRLRIRSKTCSFEKPINVKLRRSSRWFYYFFI